MKEQYQGNLSKEERVALAEQKIKEARERRKIEEAKQAKEAEAARRIADKELAAAKRVAKEREQQLAFEQQKKEKKEFLEAKKKMEIQLARDKAIKKCERDGTPWDEKEFMK